MVDICFLGGLYPDKIEGYLSKNSRWGIMYAANNHQHRLIEGFEENGRRLTVITAPFLSTFLRGYKKIMVPGCKFGKDNNYVSIPFINVFLFRNIVRNLVKELELWYNQSKAEKKCIWIYCLNSFLIKAAIQFKMTHNDVFLCQMIPDLPEDMSANALYCFLGLKQKDTDYIYESMSKMDMFIYLSEKMNNKVNPLSHPYLVSEGIYNNAFTVNGESGKVHNMILYTGNLNRKYGIEHLINAFNLLKDTSNPYQLYVRGDGDLVDYVKTCEKNNPNIHYLERMNYSDLLLMQRKASVLINPVLPSESFTDYFFPSKTMEYLASGTPVIMYKLGGVPDEYYQFIQVPRDNTPQALADKISEICNMSNDSLVELGEAGKNFILHNKNAAIMASKINSFIELQCK